VDPRPPDVIVLGPEWPERALLRAQLIEEGYEVVAVDAWPIPRPYRRAGMNRARSSSICAGSRIRVRRWTRCDS
jgi:hypothetical protein